MKILKAAIAGVRLNVFEIAGNQIVDYNDIMPLVQ
jgi:hypothetical protein